MGWPVRIIRHGPCVPFGRGEVPGTKVPGHTRPASRHWSLGPTSGDEDMDKALKGALAAGGASVLLLGGAGTLAFWTDAEDVGGTQITSGNLTLSAPDCSTAAGAHDWELDGGVPFVPGTHDLVPGDSISKVCDMELTVTGTHVGATLAASPAVFTDATSTLDASLTSSAVFRVNNAAYVPITAAGTYAVRATLTVTLASTVDTLTSQDGDVDLDAITVTATQTHDPT